MLPSSRPLLDIFTSIYQYLTGFPCSSNGKESACNAGDQGSIPGLGRSSGEGYGSPLQSSCLENPMARAAWWATVHGVTKSQTRLKRLSTQGPNVLSVSNIVCACFGASPVAQLVKNLPAMRETWVRFLGWEDPLEK